MNWLDLSVVCGIVALVTAVYNIWARTRVTSAPRVYECQEVVLVSYNGPCGQTAKFFHVTGDCTPLCPKHNKPMVRVS